MVRKLAVQLCVFIGLALACQAGVISSDTWYQFSFSDPGTPAIGCDPADPAGAFCLPSSGTPTEFADAPPWTINLSTGGVFLITDVFESGDTFQVFDSGVLIGSSSDFVPQTDCGDDPVVCFLTPGMSTGAFVLTAGAHSFTIVATAVPSGSGTGYFNVATVPEPGQAILVALGLAPLVVRRVLARRRR